MGKKSTKVYSLLIKKSPVVIVKKFVTIELVAFAAYALAASLVYYAKIYRTLGIAKLVPFQLAQAGFLFLVETGLLFYVFLYWYKDYFQIDRQKITHSRGIIYRHKEVINLDRVASVSYHHGFLGKLTKYGTVELKDGTGHRLMEIVDIPDPQMAAGLIIKYQRPNAVMRESQTRQLGLDYLLTQAEHHNLEFKSTLRWDLREKKVNKNLEKSALKTIAAFLNSQGGQLLIGVDDARQVVGLAGDFATLGKPNIDGFENHFSHLFNNMIGAEFRRLVNVKWLRQDDKDVCHISVASAHRPVYFKDEDKEEFYIRTGNGTTSLKFSEAAAYVDSHWKGELL